MNPGNFSSIFRNYLSVISWHRKTCVANSWLRVTKGTREVRKARKYKRPEDLEDPYYYGIGPKKKFEAVTQSLAARGFARERPSYCPPANLEDKLHTICKVIYGSQLKEDWKSSDLSDSLFKYKLLTKCMNEFGGNIPNSYLHKMNTIQDVCDYFSTPVMGHLHYDALTRDSDNLPQNLVVMPQAEEFHSDTDTFFGGVTAFPGRRKVIATKTGEKFEKIIHWPHI